MRAFGLTILWWLAIALSILAQDPLPQVADTKFSVDRGFFQAPFYVQITTATDGAQILYTTDGAQPGSVFTSKRYPDGDGILIETTTVLRVLATKPGHAPSNVDTHTYIFPNDVVHQPDEPAGFSTAWQGSDYGMEQDPGVLPLIAGNATLSIEEANAVISESLLTIPTLSLVMAHADLFGSSKGIYHNTQGLGKAWERPVSAELIFPDGRSGFQIDAGIRMQGFTSRNPSRNPKHSLRLVFREEYGASKLNYPLFGHRAARRFDTLVLRSNSQDAWVYDSAGNRAGQFVRDEWNRRMQRALDQPAPHGTWVHLYLNGLYWGVYNPTERPDASFMAAYFGGDKDQYDILKNHEEVVDGNGDAYQALLAVIQNDPNNFSRGYRDLSSPADYQKSRDLIDPRSLIDYLIPNMYSAAVDWPGNNYIGRDRLSVDAGFKFFSWDNEHGLKGSVNENRVLPHSRDADSPTKFHHALKGNLEYRMLFADHVHRAFFNGGPLAVDPVDPSWDPELPERNRPAASWVAVTAEIETALIAESARWGDYRRRQPYTVQGDFLKLRDSLLENWFPYRSRIILDQFRDEGLYPKLEAPGFNQHGGVIADDFRLAITSKSVNPFLPGSRILYTLDGSDPRLMGGAVAPMTQVASGSLALTQTTTIKARVEHGGDWSALNEATFLVDTLPASAATLIISAVHYHPAPPSEAEVAAGFTSSSDFEYLAFTNMHAIDSVSLRGLDLHGGVRFDFDHASLQDLPANSTAYLVNNPDGFAIRATMSGALVLGAFQGKLSNGGETLLLLDANNTPILTFRYDDTQDWPQAADGQGPPLQLVTIDAGTNLNDPSSWSAEESATRSPFEVWLMTQPSKDATARFHTTPYSNLAAFYLGADLDDVRFEISQHTLHYTRRRNVTGLVSVLETSPDLERWQALESQLNESQPHPSPDLETVTVALPSLNNSSGQYVRLRISTTMPPG